MSKTAGLPTPEPSWKQEVNRRLAAHKSRKGPSIVTPASRSGEQSAGDSVAAQAAARVAARYAKAPSYSDMLADEARAAVRAAEAAAQAALHAQAAAEAVLAGIEARSDTEPQWQRDLYVEPAHAPVSAATPAVVSIEHQPVERPTIERQLIDRQDLEIRWEPDMPVRQVEPAEARARSEAENAAEEQWRSPAELEHEALQLEAVEPAQPIHANLIEFPRELVATRKVRPRLADSAQPAPSGHEGQLSIFEVDPGAISIDPSHAGSTAAPSAPEWSDIQLDAHPVQDLAPEAAQVAAPPQLALAPFGLRLMATVVDTALTTAAFLVASVVAAENISHLPTGRVFQLVAVGAFLLTALLYQLLFFTMADATPGMRWAHIALCTFDDQNLTRAQMRRRLGALLLSVLPVGLGVVWAIFDEDHLCWHDRLSRTYPRKY